MCLMLITFVEICETFYTEEERIPRNFNIHFSSALYKSRFHLCLSSWFSHHSKEYSSIYMFDGGRTTVAMTKFNEKIRLWSVTVYLRDVLLYIFHSVT